MKKAVVTNALSVVGYALCRRLLEEGIEVAAIDDVSAGEDREEKRDYFGRNALFTFFNGEIDQIDLREALEGADVCFHVASPLEESTSIHQALRTALHNTRIFLEAAPKNPPFIVLNSSTEIYGAAAGKMEKSDKIWPTSLRGIVSVVEETLWAESDLPVAVLRLPEIDKSDQIDDGDDQQLSSERKLKTEATDGLSIEDAVEACLSAAEKKETGIFNLSGGRAGTE